MNIIGSLDGIILTYCIWVSGLSCEFDCFQPEGITMSKCDISTIVMELNPEPLNPEPVYTYIQRLRRL